MFGWIHHIRRPSFSRFTFDQILGLKKMPRDHLAKNHSHPYYYSEKIRRLVTMLNYLLSVRAKLIIIMGERGSGKTSFLNQWISESKERWRHQKFSIYTHGEGGDHSLPYLHDPKKVFINDIRPPTILIDDGHLIGATYLEQFIKSLVQSGKKYGSVVLFLRPEGMDSLRTFLDYFPHTSSVTLLQMPALDLKETKGYLNFRIFSGGILRKMPFSSEAVEAIHYHSKGIIGRINGEAYMVLKSEYHGRKKVTIFLLALFGFFRADFLIRPLLSFQQKLKSGFKNP